MSKRTLAPIRVPKTAELMAAKIRSDILEGDLRPGDRLPPEDALMSTFGVSRPTLREAIRLLEAEELIDVRRGARGGAVVRRPSAQPALRTAAAWLALGDSDPDNRPAAARPASDVDLMRIAEQALRAALAQARAAA